MTVVSQFHCRDVAETLQKSWGVYVKDKTPESWQFEYKSATLKLRVMPGCCGIMLIYHIHGEPKHAHRLIKAACQAARKSGFGMVVMSLLSASHLRLRLGNEWKSSQPFKNPRTRNDVELLSYALPVKIKPKPPERNHEDT